MTRETINITNYLQNLKSIERENEENLSNLSKFHECKPTEVIRKAIGEWNGRKFTKHFINRIKKEAEKVENFDISLSEGYYGNLTVTLYYTLPSGEILRESIVSYSSLNSERKLDVERLIKDVDNHLNTLISSASPDENTGKREEKLEKVNDLFNELEELLKEVTKDGDPHYTELLAKNTHVASVIRSIVR